MPQFVAALLALISSFSHGGQPLTIHPQTSNITPLGSQVSDLAKTFHLQNS
ncbi:hypothetical protein HY029_00230, partial [Candidatus Gottesmanbacteria bacterium]|nr:hypothetical protein [Candidatus Gottesmanbacteria bacterium]